MGTELRVTNKSFLNGASSFLQFIIPDTFKQVLLYVLAILILIFVVTGDLVLTGKAKLTIDSKSSARCGAPWLSHIDDLSPMTCCFR